ncbi:MAG: AAA family ATPase [Thermoguttaceae bacterium]|nr:AAA family ATPase [Thermoguttaceae bacterium]
MMGNDFFGFSKRPFYAEPIPEAYCPFGSAEAARVEISRCVERLEGVALASGLTGTGKTLLCRKIQAQFARKMQTILLNGHNLNHPKTFFESVLSRLNIPFDPQSLGTMRDALNAALETSNRFHSGILLLIDDAQATGIRVFEEIRQLMDRAVKPESGVRVVLFGDMSLEEKLSFPQLHSFSQRVTTRCFLETMNRDETTGFLWMELEQSGTKKELFSRDVCREIHRFSEGVPRVTNQLADLLLIVAEEESKISAKEKKDAASGSDLNEVKLDELNFEPTFPGDASGINIFEDPGNSTLDLAKKSKSKTSSKRKQTPEITVAMVRKAWNRLQQLPEGSGTEAESDAKADLTPADSGNSASVPAAVSGTHAAEKPSSPSSSIEFGSLDDDLDSENSIDLGGESVEDATMIWSYDEMEDVRNAVEAANALPEEWEAAARENAQKEEEAEKAKAKAKAKENENEKVNPAADAPSNVSVQKQETLPENQNKAPVQMQVMRETPAMKEEMGPQVPRIEKVPEKNGEWWDVYREQSNIEFPDRKGPQWVSPYSSGTPNYSGSSSPVSHQVPPVSVGAVPPVRRSNDVSTGKRVVNYLSVPPVCPRSVDELIYDSIMDSTVHSMGLLQNILHALHEENQKNQSTQPPAEYWYTLQDSTMALMRQIARERLARSRQSLVQDFFQPESLVEKDAYSSAPSQVSDSLSCPLEPKTGPVSQSGPQSVSQPVPQSNSQSVPQSVSQPPVQRPGESPRSGNSFDESQEMQEISELRKVLRGAQMDPNAQEKILDIISRLQTLNQCN